MVHVRRQPPDPAGLPPCGRSGCRSRQHPGPGAQRRAIAWCPSLGRTKRKRAIARSKPHPLRAHFLQPAPTAHASYTPNGPRDEGGHRGKGSGRLMHPPLRSTSASVRSTSAGRGRPHLMTLDRGWIPSWGLASLAPNRSQPVQLSMCAMPKSEQVGGPASPLGVVSRCGGGSVTATLRTDERGSIAMRHWSRSCR